MSSIRTRTRRDGTSYTQVLYRDDNGKQSGCSFEDPGHALDWKKLLDTFGVDFALKQLQPAEDVVHIPTVKAAGASYITDLTGVQDGTRTRYRAYMRNDVEKYFGANMLVTAISAIAVRKWVNHLQKKRKNSPKTIANKHGFLYGLMESLRIEGVIETNPCQRTKLPRVDMAEMCFLEVDEFEVLHDTLPARWRLFVKFLVASGCRWGEATALRVGDIDRRRNTVRISRAWKYTGGKRELGAPKTKKGRRTVSLDPTLIDELDLTGRSRGDWLFTNERGEPIHVTTFYKQVWRPTLDALTADLADPEDDPLHGKRPRIHDLRHTCASWLLNANTPLQVVQAHLGHESIKTTSDRYGHLDRRTAAEAALTLGKSLPSNEPTVVGIRAVGVDELLPIAARLEELTGTVFDISRLGGSVEGWLVAWCDGPTKGEVRALLSKMRSDTTNLQLARIQTLRPAAA